MKGLKKGTRTIAVHTLNEQTATTMVKVKERYLPGNGLDGSFPVSFLPTVTVFGLANNCLYGKATTTALQLT